MEMNKDEWNKCVFLFFHLHHSSPVDVHCVVVDHFYNGHTQIAANTKWDTETQATKNGNDVALGQAEAATIEQRWATVRRWHRPTILR